MSMLIDHNGWFNATQYSFGWNRIFGILLVLLGVLLATAIRSKKNEQYSPKQIRRVCGIYGFGA